MFPGGQHQDVRLCRQSFDCSSLLRLLIEMEKYFTSFSHLLLYHFHAYILEGKPETSSITDRDGKSLIRGSFALTLGGHTVLFRNQKIQLNWIIIDVYFTSFSHLLLYYFYAYILEGNRRLQEDYAIVRLFCLSYLLLWKRCTRNAKTRKPPRLFMFDIRYSNVN